LADYYLPGPRTLFDLAPLLFQGMILREKDLRDFAAAHDWAQYEGHLVGLVCTADALVPVWAYMLLATKLAPYAKLVAFGNAEALEAAAFRQALAQLPLEDYRDRPVVVKGCGDTPIPEAAYVEAARLLQPVAKSIMYGEPCSTVPLYKRPKG
jgi:hypothetical protein